jgi:hypothetical protein
MHQPPVLIKTVHSHHFGVTATHTTPSNMQHAWVGDQKIQIFLILSPHGR